MKRRSRRFHGGGGVPGKYVGSGGVGTSDHDHPHYAFCGGGPGGCIPYRTGNKGANPYRRGGRIMRNGGGTRSLHPHTYPNGPYGPSGNAITTGPSSTWGWGHNGQVVQPFHSSVQQHWGQYPGGYSHGEPGGPHYGYRHSSLDHSHQPKHLRRRPRTSYYYGGKVGGHNPYNQDIPNTRQGKSSGRNPY